MESRVVDTTYYDLLNVSPAASDLELKKAYRRAALINHPDKNPGDEAAQLRFQEIAKAYQVLSDPTQRNAYDQIGLTASEPQGGFEDPSELFTRVFGGDAFREWIGELSYLKDVVKMMEIKSQDPEDATEPDEENGASKDLIYYEERRNTSVHEEQVRPGASTRGQRHHSSKSTSSRRTSATQRRTPSGKNKRQLEDYERQKRVNHERRIETLSSIILSKIEGVVKNPNDWQELYRLESKIRDEAESMKLESFGDQLLHTIGESFVNRSKAFRDAIIIITPICTWLGDRRQEFRDVYEIVSSGLEASKAITSIKKVEDELGEDESSENRGREEMTEEKKMAVGKVLTACWKTIVKEVHDITRELCDKILYEEDVSYDCRQQRANILIIIGEIFLRTARQPGDEVTEQFFEILVSDASRNARK